MIVEKMGFRTRNPGKQEIEFMSLKVIVEKMGFRTGRKRQG